MTWNPPIGKIVPDRPCTAVLLYIRSIIYNILRSIWLYISYILYIYQVYARFARLYYAGLLFSCRNHSNVRISALATREQRADFGDHFISATAATTITSTTAVAVFSGNRRPYRRQSIQSSTINTTAILYHPPPSARKETVTFTIPSTPAARSPAGHHFPHQRQRHHRRDTNSDTTTNTTTTNTNTNTNTITNYQQHQRQHQLAPLYDEAREPSHCKYTDTYTYTWYVPGTRQYGMTSTTTNKATPRPSSSSSCRRRRRPLLPSSPLASLNVLPLPVVLAPLLLVLSLETATKVCAEETSDDGEERGPNSSLAHEVEVSRWAYYYVWYIPGTHYNCDTSKYLVCWYSSSTQQYASTEV